MKAPKKYRTLSVERADGRVIDIPYVNPVNLDRLLRTLTELRDMEMRSFEPLSKDDVPA